MYMKESMEVNGILYHSYSFIIPVFNSENSLRDLVGELEKVLREIDGPFEVIMVNDGSYDRSWNIICELAQSFSWFKGY